MHHKTAVTPVRRLGLIELRKVPDRTPSRSGTVMAGLFAETRRAAATRRQRVSGAAWRVIEGVATCVDR
jgi:hypothetical protein